MFKIRSTDTHLVIERSVTYREPFRYRLFALVTNVFFWLSIGYIASVIGMLVTLRYGVSVFLISMFSMLGIAVLIGFFAIRYIYRLYRLEAKFATSLLEIIQVFGRLPKRWRKEWEAVYPDDRVLQFVLNHMIKKRVIIEDDILLTSMLRVEISKAKEKLQELSISYESYPIAFILLFTGSKKSHIRAWDEGGVPMVNALRLTIQGVEPHIITRFGKDDIDLTMINAVISGGENDWVIGLAEA